MFRIATRMNNGQHNNFFFIGGVVNAIKKFSYKCPPYIFKHSTELFRIVFNSGKRFFDTRYEFFAETLSATFIVTVGFCDIRFGFLPNG